MNKALFLDRDGVVNEETNYLYKIEEVVFIDEIFEVCEFYKNQGFLIFIITNQAGIARGFFSETDFETITAFIHQQFREKGITIEKTYHCPHHPDITGPCKCRKPEPGMILQAQNEFDLDLEHSVLIGDKLSDIEAGLNAGINHSYHIEEILSILNHLPNPE